MAISLTMVRGDQRSAIGVVAGVSTIVGARIDFTAIPTAVGPNGQTLPAISKSVGNGVTIISPTSYRVVLLPGDTNQLPNDVRTLRFSVRLTLPSGAPATMVSGTITVTPSV